MYYKTYFHPDGVLVLEVAHPEKKNEHKATHRNGINEHISIAISTHTYIFIYIYIYIYIYICIYIS